MWRAMEPPSLSSITFGKVVSWRDWEPSLSCRSKEGLYIKCCRCHLGICYLLWTIIRLTFECQVHCGGQVSIFWILWTWMMSQQRWIIMGAFWSKSGISCATDFSGQCIGCWNFISIVWDTFTLHKSGQFHSEILLHNHWLIFPLLLFLPNVLRE